MMNTFPDAIIHHTALATSVLATMMMMMRIIAVTICYL